MQSVTELQEIEKLGEEKAEPREEPRKKDGGGSGLPLVQAAVCILILLALACLKLADCSSYNRAADWYRCEASRETVLSALFGSREEAPAQTPVPVDPGALQQV